MSEWRGTFFWVFRGHSGDARWTKKRVEIWQRASWEGMRLAQVVKDGKR